MEKNNNINPDSMIPMYKQIVNLLNEKIEKRMDLIQKKLRTLMSGLANCGLNSIQVSNSDLRMVLDNFLNGGTQTNFGTVMF